MFWQDIPPAAVGNPSKLVLVKFTREKKKIYNFFVRRKKSIRNLLTTPLFIGFELILSSGDRVSKFDRIGSKWIIGNWTLNKGILGRFGLFFQGFFNFRYFFFQYRKNKKTRVRVCKTYNRVFTRRPQHQWGSRSSLVIPKCLTCFKSITLQLFSKYFSAASLDIS